MNACARSRTGWTSVVAYRVFGVLLLGQASTFTGWPCGLVALPVALPLGLPVAWPIDGIHGLQPIPGHIPSAHLGNAYVILPTVAANAVLCSYCLAGRPIEASLRRWPRGAPPTALMGRAPAPGHAATPTPAP